MTAQYRIKHASTIPATPGVYFFSSGGGSASGGKIVYIGKAVNLRNRLRGHPMLEKASTLDWQECGSEIEALILKSRLIKKYKPKYNISLRDDKSYAYVKITDEPFPKIFVAHRAGIGPFTSSTELRVALKALRRLFPYCTCTEKHNRLCLNAHLGKCIGECCLKNEQRNTNNEKLYLENIKIIKDILSGSRTSIIKKFPNTFANIKVLKEIAGREDALSELQKIFKIKNILNRIEGYDISNIQGKFATGSMVVFENGMPNKSEYRKFKIRAPASPDDTLMLNEMLSRRFAHDDWPRPDVILIDGGIGQFNIAKKYFSPVVSIAKGKQEIFSTTLPKPIPLQQLATSIQRLVLHIDAEAHRFAIGYYRRLHRKATML